MFKKLNKNFYSDLSIGFGIKYINSFTIGKKQALNKKTERYSGNVFEGGQTITYHPLLHFKIGYNF